ncbi:AAA family ATPase [Planctomycetales bacterium ZRK34]|nr:AAA family ATPase [Planctomycetales bacterium ZRK34]
MSDPHPIHRVLQQYLNRLNAAIVRSPLLDATCGAIGRGRRIDLTHLDLYDDGQGIKLLRRMMSGRHSMPIRPTWNRWNVEDDLEMDLLKLYRQVERNLVREANKIERETGNRSLWMGYPLLHVVDPQDRERSILAPVLLWPMRVALDTEHQWALRIDRDKLVEDPVPNQVMRAWVERRLGVRLELEPSAAKSPEDLQPLMQEWMVRLKSSTTVDLNGSLNEVPRKAELPKNSQPHVVHASILGVMRWQNQALMDDLEELLKQRQFVDGSFQGLFLGQDLSSRHVCENIGENHRHYVTPADFSQEQAVIKAQQEPGVVVHGPPGTGKSQTITNIVADALARREKVLVVCQKRAAIDVVAQRLKAAGLDDLYLTVHDATGDRESIIDLLKEQLDRLKNDGGRSNNGVVKRRERLCRQIEDAEQELDLSHREYHKQRSFGLSFQQLTAKLVRVEDGPRIDPDSELSKRLSMSDWASVEQFCDRLDPLARLFVLSSPLENPWRHRLPDFTLSPHSQRAVEETLVTVRIANDHHLECCEVAGQSISIGDDPQAFLDHAKGILPLFEPLLEQDDVDAFLKWLARCAADKHVWEQSESAVSLAKLLATSGSSRDQRVADLIPQLDENESRRILALLEGALGQPWRWYSLLTSNYRRHRRALKRSLENWALQWSRSDLELVQAELLHRLQQQNLTAALDAAGLVGVDGDTDVSRDGETSRLARWLNRAKRISDSRIVQNSSLVAAGLKVASKGSVDELNQWLEQLRAAMKQAEALAALLEQMDTMKSFFEDDFLRDLRQTAVAGGDLRDQLIAIEEGFDRLGELEQYDRARNRESSVHQVIIDRLGSLYSSHSIDGNSLAALWVRTTKVSALTTWRSMVLRETPIVADVHGLRLQQLREQLSAGIEEKMKLEPQALTALWQAQQTPATQRPWGRVLVKRGKNAKRLREVVEIGHPYGLFELRPCWLTNPDTASQVLPAVEGLFDLVVFDEASQLPVEQAAPAVYRGRRIVVAGDEHQLPPTSFFTTSAGDDQLPEAPDLESEEDADAAVVAPGVDDSGIDLAVGATDLLDLSKRVLPEHQLTVHYRSRHPALIQFSNWAYYRGNLEAAHPVWGIEEAYAAPIRIHRIDGVYENKQNRAEARYVVDLLDQLWNSYDQPPTIGVVTFNQQQEKLIETELDRRAYEDHNFRAQLQEQQDRKDGRQDVGFFVKNLESVQGDERDLIIFSTTFGPAERGDHGTFRRYFGPLTQMGGERRLNVAVTRSKHGMIIVTSMPFEKISDVVGGVEPGQKIKARDFLQSYMLYADAVSRADRQGVETWLDRIANLSAATRGARHGHVAEFDSILEEQVYERLVGAGYTVDTQVGEAGFRIDLAVRHPESGRGYLLGIECDGATYHSGRAARSRDVWREQILKSYGWDIFRIWSTRWWTHPDTVMQELLERLRDREKSTDSRGQLLVLPDTPDAEVYADLDDQPVEQATTSTTKSKSAARRMNRKRTATRPTLFMQTASSIPAKEEPQVLDGQPKQWAMRLEKVFWSAAVADGTIAEWEVAGMNYRIEVSRRRGKRLISLMCNQEAVEHCALPEINDDVAETLLSDLSQLNSTTEIHDWFRRLQSALYPELWG